MRIILKSENHKRINTANLLYYRKQFLFRYINVSNFTKISQNYSNSIIIHGLIHNLPKLTQCRSY